MRGTSTVQRPPAPPSIMRPQARPTVPCPQAGAEMSEDSDGSSDSEISISPDDSASHVGSAASTRDAPANVMARFKGLEDCCLPGMAGNFPKPSTGIAPTPGCSAIWWNMRGFGVQDSKKKLKADKIETMYTSPAALAFAPPEAPPQLPLEGGSLTADQRIAKRQKSFGAPAHLTCIYLDEVKAAAILPLVQAAQLTSDPAVLEGINKALDFLQLRAANVLSSAVRSLAASFNALAHERLDGLVKVQSTESKRAVENIKPGFDTFFDKDVGTLLNVASQTTQMRLTQLALSRFSGASGSSSYKRHDNRGKGGRGNGRGNGRYTSTAVSRDRQPYASHDNGRKPHFKKGGNRGGNNSSNNNNNNNGHSSYKKSSYKKK
jgi:hypothetical protein